MLVVHGKEIPTELAELVDPTATALAIVDMQNDCCAVGGSADLAGADLSMYRDITPRIAALADACRRAGVPVIHVRIHTLPDGRSDSPAWIRFRMRANKNYDPSNEGIWHFTLEGSWGAEFIDELQPQPGDLVVTKFRSSAFANTNLDLLLRSNGVRTLMVAGCTTEGCVESTVRDACFYDYFPRGRERLRRQRRPRPARGVDAGDGRLPRGRRRLGRDHGRLGRRGGRAARGLSASRYWTVSVMFTPASACETGQPALAASAFWRNVSASMPLALPLTVSALPVIGGLAVGSNETAALISRWMSSPPAWPSSWESAIA